MTLIVSGLTISSRSGKRSDLTFLDPMNKADCPPKAIALAAGELVLRIREEKRRREVGGIAAEPALPTKRMCGGKPGTAYTLTCLTSGSVLQDVGLVLVVAASQVLHVHTHLCDTRGEQENGGWRNCC